MRKYEIKDIWEDNLSRKETYILKEGKKFIRIDVDDEGNVCAPEGIIESLITELNNKTEKVENDPTTISIPKTVYLELQKRDRQLTYLENYGVDNWEGFGLAMTDFCKAEGDDE